MSVALRYGLLAVVGALGACAEPVGPAEPLLPAGQWLRAEGAGESALVFVPEGGGGEIVAVCTMGVAPTFRIETTDAAFAAVAAGPRADIVIGGLSAFEATLSRMTVEGGAELVQASAPITQGLIEALREGPDLRLNVGAGQVQTGAAPDAEMQAFAAACASLAGLGGP